MTADRVEAALRAYCFAIRAHYPDHCSCSDKAGCEAPEFPLDVKAMSSALAAADALAPSPAPLDREAMVRAAAIAWGNLRDRTVHERWLAAVNAVLELLPAAPPPIGLRRVRELEEALREADRHITHLTRGSSLLSADEARAWRDRARALIGGGHAD